MNQMKHEFCFFLFSKPARNKPLRQGFSLNPEFTAYKQAG